MEGYEAGLEVEAWMPDDAELADPAETFVLDVLAAHLELKVEVLSLAHHLERDLGITPLGLVVIGLDIEDVQSVRLPFEELIRVKTIGDLVDFVRAAGVV